MKKLILFAFSLFLFANYSIAAPVLPSDYSQGNSLPYDEVNQMIAERKGDLFPIDETTREYVDGTEDLGSATYQWNSLFLDNTLDFGTRTIDTNGNIEGGFTFNNTAANVDLQVKGQTDPNTLYIDASSDSFGIGTNSPSTKFHLSKGMGTSGTIATLENTTAATQANLTKLSFKHWSSNWGANNAAAIASLHDGTANGGADLQFFTAESGAAEPALKMELSKTGELFVGGVLDRDDFQWNTSTNERGFLFTGASGTNGFGSILVGHNDTAATSQTLGSIIFGQKVSGIGVNSGLKAFIQSVSQGSGGATGGFGGDMRFSTRSDNVSGVPTLRMIIDHNGNVGVGTSSPDKKVEINSGSVQLRLTNTDAVDYTDLTTDSNGDYTIDPSGGDVTIDGTLSLNNQPKVRVYDSGSNITIPDITSLNVTWNAEVYDVGNMHNTSTNTERITVSSDGIYSFCATVKLTFGSSGSMAIRIIDNSGDEWARDVKYVSGPFLFSHSISGHANLSDGDYLIIEINQNTGTTATLSRGTNDSWFQVTKLH